MTTRPDSANAIIAEIAVLEMPRQLVFRKERLDPASLKPREILAQTLVTAISPGTELAAYSGAPPLRPGVVYPRFLGYCNVSRVVAAGRDTSVVSVGDRILTFSSHRSHFRMHSDDILAVLPAEITNDDAVCAYLFHLGYDAVMKAEIRPGSVVVVIGLGVLGLAAVALASIAGAQVFAISDQEKAHVVALEFGAQRCFTRSKFPDLLKELGQARAHAIITTSNSWSDWRRALESAGDLGTIAVLGFPGRQETDVPFNPLDSAHFYVRQLRIVAAGLSPERADSRGYLPFNEKENLGRLIAWIQRGRLRPARLVSGRFPWSKLADAYERLQNRGDSTFTYLLDWNA